jgi:t-SNARE complex subunit (syntaxin)
MQYEAQVDVLGQLEQRVQHQLQNMIKQSTSGSTSNPQIVTIVTKLKRDYERVQAQARSLQDTVHPKLTAIKDAKHQSSQHNFHMNHNDGTDQSSPEAIVAEHQRQIQLQMQEDRLAEEIMREREEEIRNINRGMHQVNEIYKDLAHIVGEQQEHIDKIETQMDDARANAEAGLHQVEKANEKYGQNQCSVM